MSNAVDDKAKKASERRDKLVNVKKRRGIKPGKNAGMSEDQSGSRKNPASRGSMEHIYERRRHP